MNRACLVLVQLTILVLLLSLLLERDDDEADEDVNHKEGDDDDVDYVEYCHCLSIAEHWAHAFFIRVDAFMHQANTRNVSW